MSVEMNKVIIFNYTLKDDTGTVLDSSENKEPLSFLSGSNTILPKLEKTLTGMIIGSKKNVKLSTEDAYGDYKEEAVQTVNKDQFPKEAQLTVGASYMANSPDGKQMPFVITEVKEQDITVDFNHPLAGKDLEFDVELIDVREATPEEMQHGHVHGPGGHHH
ncbi:MAG: peptidylprolyl isomerase [Ignavibacteria bacterium]|nr:peptidylprolyl isomerase [Ignavibacteria bacterium]MBT8391911.1 peptidylprolyl isomerase [Ignavibacteria bacterium]NNJ53526.1 peptidylprolyl isomerase [Ignavibacteriaceae bacterium]